jgi:NADH-quinone oxidoreductase subunit A
LYAKSEVNSKELPKIEAENENLLLMLLTVQSTPVDFVPIAITFVVALGFVMFMLFLTHKLGPKKKSKVKLDTFECGIEVQGNARIPFSIKYFLVAILFVLFDVEVIFMYPWAVNFKGLGLTGFVEMLTFVGFLLVGFYYIIKKGALKWE